MNLDWLAASNPVAIWWCFLLIVSTANIALWMLLHRRYRQMTPRTQRGIFRVEVLVLLCTAYVFGCAFRSVLPRADVQRISLFDTWLSSVFVGRSVATVAEICFVLQWAIVLYQLAKLAKADTARNIAMVIVPLILLAETFSWYAVITTNYLGNTLENSLWAVTFLLIAVALLRLLNDFRGAARFAIGLAVVGITAYLVFLVVIDVPMYFDRWQHDMASGKELFGLLAGLHDLTTRWTVTHDIAQWQDEIAWMSLYFSVAVWSSLALAASRSCKTACCNIARGLGVRAWRAATAAQPQRGREVSRRHPRVCVDQCALIRGFAAVEDARAADPIRRACAFRFPARADPGRWRTCAPRGARPVRGSRSHAAGRRRGRCRRAA